MDIYKYTSVGRPLDNEYKTNRFIGYIILITIGAAFIYQILSDTIWVDSIWWSLGAGLTVFLSWALAREFDPDHDYAAFVAAGLSVIALVLFGLPDFLVLFWFLLAGRIINRTTGLPARVQDSIIVLLIAGWLTFKGNWGIGVATIYVFVSDSKLEPQLKKQWIFAAIISLALALLLEQVIWYYPFDFLPQHWIPVVIVLLTIPFIFSQKEIKSKGDVTNKPLSPLRVQTVQRLFLFTVLFFIIWDSTLGLKATFPVWSAMAGASFFHFGAMLIKR